MGERPILVVDDEQAIRDLVAEVLIGEGYVVVSVADGQEALHLIDDALPALIILDLHMPHIDGFAFMAALAERGIAVPTLVISAAANLPTHADRLGAAGFIAKPFEIPHLLTAVERHYRGGG